MATEYILADKKGNEISRGTLSEIANYLLTEYDDETWRVIVRYNLYRNRTGAESLEETYEYLMLTGQFIEVFNAKNRLGLEIM
ncbi:hypothetical protein [Megamonas hypermegale]|uniref:hypothetical protein n=1 Tax=Megamonas hypermegale TaxID=158847 RepID=UPI0026F1DEE9|nr:hypothetical protein [Megamonas hypermegale]